MELVEAVMVNMIVATARRCLFYYYLLFLLHKTDEVDVVRRQGAVFEYDIALSVRL